MHQETHPTRHRIRNLSPAGPRLSTLRLLTEAPHYSEPKRVGGEET